MNEVCPGFEGPRKRHRYIAPAQLLKGSLTCDEIHNQIVVPVHNAFEPVENRLQNIVDIERVPAVVVTNPYPNRFRNRRDAFRPSVKCLLANIFAPITCFLRLRAWRDTGVAKINSSKANMPAPC